MYLAENYLKMQVEERDVYVDKLDQFKEAGACGTAAVIKPKLDLLLKSFMILFAAYSLEKYKHLKAG